MVGGMKPIHQLLSSHEQFTSCYSVIFQFRAPPPLIHPLLFAAPPLEIYSLGAAASSPVMASKQRDGQGSGGKVLRGRSLVPRFSPYSRPSSSSALVPLPAPEVQNRRSPSWIWGLISSAGKLITSVLGSDGSGSSQSECFSDSPSDDYYYSSPSDNDQLLSDGLTKFKMRESDEERNVGSLAIIPESETKLIIEQLLMQETFTRDECNKLMEVIRSRVIDIPSAEVGEEILCEVSERVAGKEPWKSLNHNKNLSETSNYTLSNLSAHSPRFYTHASVSPDILNKAVMEAKKWFKEKKPSPSSKYNQECGPCNLNTDLNQYGFDSNCSSPIEMARSYMQSLPSWRSPSFSTVGFKTPPLSGNCNSYNIGNHLPASEFNEVDYLAGHEDLFGGDKFSDKHLSLLDGEAAEAYQQMETENDFSEGIIFQPKQMLKESQEDGNLPLQTEEQIDNTFAPQNSLVLASTASRDDENFPQTETLLLEIVTIAEPSVQKISNGEVKFQANNCIQVNPDAGFKLTDSINDSKPPVVNPCIQGEAIISEAAIKPNGKCFTENNMNSDLVSMSKWDPTTTNMSNDAGTAAASITEGTHEPLSDVSTDIPSTLEASSNASKPGAKAKSMEGMLTETPKQSGGKRKAKKVGRPKKLRG